MTEPLPIAAFEEDLADQLELLQALVELESPTTEKAAVDALGARVAEEMRQRGAAVQRFPRQSAGDHWVGQWGDGPDGILVLAHIDTVHALGTIEDMPWRISKGRVHGPGVLDMKSGLTIALTAIEAVRRASRLPRSSVRMLCTSDEETGSHTSRELIEDMARGSLLVLCMEPGLPDGSLKTWRKGIGDFRIEVAGRAAHAGANPEAGVNAIVEMAHVIRKLSSLEDLEKGTTVSVGVVGGGTRTNVVPASCFAEVDMRVLEEAEMDRLRRAMSELEPSLPGARISFEGSWNRPPMPRSPIMADAFGKAKAIASMLGLELTEGGTGGGSDANFVAPLGVPVLDGLGAVGNGAHSEREYIELGSLPTRTALLAALISEWR
jgi:glutamate carboxypeptidase